MEPPQIPVEPFDSDTDTVVDNDVDAALPLDDFGIDYKKVVLVNTRQTNFSFLRNSVLMRISLYNVQGLVCLTVYIYCNGTLVYFNANTSLND